MVQFPSNISRKEFWNKLGPPSVSRIGIHFFKFNLLFRGDGRTPRQRRKQWTRNWKCLAGTRLSAIGRLLREMRPDGTLFCRVSWISALCNYFFDVLWEMLVGCTGFVIFWCTYIFFLFRLCPYIGLACGRSGWLDLTWLDLTWLGINWSCHIVSKQTRASVKI